MIYLVEYSTNKAAASFMGDDGQLYVTSGPDFSLAPKKVSEKALAKAKAVAEQKNVAFDKNEQASRFIKASQKTVDLEKAHQLIQSLPEPLPHIDKPESARSKIHRRVDEALRSDTLTPSFMGMLSAFNATFGLSSATKNLIKRAEPDRKLREQAKDTKTENWDDFAQDYLAMVNNLLIKRGKLKEAKFALLQLQNHLSPEAEKRFSKALDQMYQQTHPNPHRDRDEDIKPWQRQVSSRPNPFKGQKKKWL
jgi:hypothetical protein